MLIQDYTQGNNLLRDPISELFPCPATGHHPTELRKHIQAPQNVRVASHRRVAVHGEGIHAEDGRIGVQEPRRLLEEPVGRRTVQPEAADPTVR